MCDTCDDSRFELIKKYKQKLLDATNIEDSPEEMAVIDNILFRFWQMGWLKGELFGNSEQLDIISRSVAIEVLNEYFSRIGKLKRRGLNNAENAIRLDTVGVIKALPSAQTGRQKGKWLPDNNNYYEERFICSVCGKSYKVDTCMGKPMWNFCPCGADMMEDGDGKCAND